MIGGLMPMRGMKSFAGVMKPENLFLVAGDDGNADRPLVKLLDVGISRLTEDGERLTTDYAPLGTAFYVSPEQIEHVSIATRRAKPPSSLVSDLPEGLEAVVMRALEKSPHDRFPTMGDLADALSAARFVVGARRSSGGGVAHAARQEVTTRVLRIIPVATC